VGDRDRYEPGTFSWLDLGAVDATAAKAFYQGLFGWEAVDRPMGDDLGPYTMFRLDGRDVCALYGRGGDGPPPAWLSYITVADADELAAKARAAGANVENPIDVFDAGRMVLVEDPTGAHFAAWQPIGNIGAKVVNVPGALCMNQLNTSDPSGAARFYGEVFGWQFQQVATGEQSYWSISNHGNLNGGMMPLPPGAGAPSHWLVYFAIADLDAGTARAGELGGQVVVPPTPVPAGRFAVVVDTEGAAFALFEGNLDP
jgi:predicted enzyme related to lactoylglutathione lyase